MSLNQYNNNLDAVEDSGGENGSNGGDESNVCLHCFTDPCWEQEIEPAMLSLVEVYGGYMANRKLRFKMYSEAVKTIHGTCLGKGVQKELPACVMRLIRRLAPDQSYTGFVQRP